MLNNGGKELLKELYAEILKAETEEEIGEFLEDLCTIKELESMSQRLKAAKMLLQGKTYNEIVENEAPTAVQMEDVRAAGQLYSEALESTELSKIEETLSANAVVLYEFKKL